MYSIVYPGKTRELRPRTPRPRMHPAFVPVILLYVFQALLPSRALAATALVSQIPHRPELPVPVAVAEAINHGTARLPVLDRQDAGAEALDHVLLLPLNLAP